MQPRSAKLTYQVITSSLKMPVFSLIREFEYAEKMSKERLEKYQWDKLNALIKHAVLYSPYYRKLFSDLGAEPEDIKNEASFRKIPFLTKSIIREKANEILVRPKPSFLTQAKSSGSTGQPIKFYKDPIGRASTYAAMYRGHRWYGVDVGDREARLWGMPIDTKSRWKVKTIDLFLNRVRQNGFQISDGIFKGFYKKMNKFRPEYLMGYPSLVYAFASFFKNNGLNGEIFNFKFVKCTAEVIHDYQKDLIENMFKCPCISEYGSAETGVVSFECPARNQHIMAESVYVEFESTNTYSLNDKMRKLIITNLYNKAFPIIRYETDDLASPVSETCSCGRSLPLMSKVLGRSSDVVFGERNKKFHSSVFSYITKNIIQRGIKINQIRFLQRVPGKVEVLIVKSANMKHEQIKIIREIMDSFFRDYLSVEIKCVSNIERDLSGKFRYFISDLE